MIMMSVHYVYMHVNFTQYLQFVHVLLTSALNPLLWKTVCDCLYLLKPWHLTAKLLIRITRELCSPCSYQSAAPVVVNTSVPPRSPSANSIQETIVSSSPYSSMCFILLEISKTLPQHTLCNFTVVFIVS